MDQTLGQDGIPRYGPMDKSRVWDVKPLRHLVPVFPSSGAASFLNVPPSGPFPSGVSPFYPFSGSAEESQGHPGKNSQTPSGVPNRNVPSRHDKPISSAVPINSYRSPPHTRENGGTGPSRPSRRTRAYATSESDSDYVEEDEYSNSRNRSARGRKPRKKYKKRTKGNQDVSSTLPEVDMDSVVYNILLSFNFTDFNSSRRADGDTESSGHVLMIFDLLRRKISQIDDSREAKAGATRRPDLRAGTILMNKGIRTNHNKRVGAVPGVEVGDIFYFRIETCLIGLHAPCMAGIDYMGPQSSQEEEPLAVSVVSSGGYEDNDEDGDVLIYSGQGGNIYRKDKEIMDQKLERGNLALEKSLHRGNEVRVIRGVKDASTPTGKIYVYDGLYKIKESWVEKGKSGCNVFKYKFVRLPGQPEAFMTWKLVQQWKDGITSRIGVILPDLSSGAEKIPVSLVNDVDDEKGPTHFKYIPSLEYSKPVNSTESSVACTCRDGCLPSNPNCPCIQKNDGYLPYTTHGVIVNQNSLTYECGACLCPPTCRNRMSQGGLKIHLEVFKTKDKGWGLRSWDPIRAGAFICEYAGEVIDISKIEELQGDNADDYIFDATRTYASSEDVARNIPYPLAISAKSVGNVARFMNHSCFPNVFWQPVLRPNNEGYDLHIAFHAMKHIPPMTELTYDYGKVLPNKAERKKNCLCGSSKCRGYFY